MPAALPALTVQQTQAISTEMERDLCQRQIPVRSVYVWYVLLFACFNSVTGKCFIGRVAFLNDHFTMKYKDLNILSILVRKFMAENADHGKIKSKFESLTKIAVDLPAI